MSRPEHARVRIAALLASAVLAHLGALVPTVRAASRARPPREAAEILRVIVLPFTPRGAPPEAWPRVREFLDELLPANGFEVVDREAVSAQLHQHRLRDVSMLAREDIEILARSLRADRILQGSIYRLEESPQPRISLSGRIINPDGLDVEAVSFSVLEGSSLLGPLGIGGPVTLERAVYEAVSEFARFLRPVRGNGATQRHLLVKSMLAPKPAVFLSPSLSERRIGRVIVLPFRNRSPWPGAGQVAADLVAWCLARTGSVSLYDEGDAARRLLERGWRTGLPVGRQAVLSLGRDPGVDAVLMGAVNHWEEGGQAGDRPPRIAFSARLLDTRSGEILWAASHERRGDETRTLYEAGNVRLAEALMARAAYEALEPLVEELSKREH